MKGKDKIRVFWGSHAYSNYSTELEAIECLARKITPLVKHIRIKVNGKPLTDSEYFNMIGKAMQFQADTPTAPAKPTKWPKPN